MDMSHTHFCYDCGEPLQRYEDMIYCSPCEKWVTPPLAELREGLDQLLKEESPACAIPAVPGSRCGGDFYAHMRRASALREAEVEKQRAHDQRLDEEGRIVVENVQIGKLHPGGSYDW